ncbi:hypothetical protein AAFH68_24210 [Flavobacterium sp. CGRL1]
MNHTLSKQEYKEFIVGSFHSKVYEEDFKYLEEIYNSSLYWERKVSGINHFLAIVLEQFAKRDIETMDIIEYIYSLPENCNFEIQESTERFIDVLYEYIINPDINLEEQLIIIQNKIA